MDCEPYEVDAGNAGFDDPTLSADFGVAASNTMDAGNAGFDDPTLSADFGGIRTVRMLQGLMPRSGTPQGPRTAMMTQQPQGFPLPRPGTPQQYVARQQNVVTTQQIPGYPLYHPGAPQQQPYAANNVIVMQTAPPQTQSFFGHLIAACAVFWCCWVLFGSIAFILALVAQNRGESGDAKGARQMGRASMGVSIAGFVTGLVIYIGLGFGM